MIYNTITKKIIKPDKHHLFSLKLSNSHERKKIALKTLYKLIYNKPFCTDRIVSNESEVWKQIDETEGLYFISNQGRIKSYQSYEAVLLKPYKNKNGYLRVDIMQHGVRYSKLVHRLVAASFLPLPEKIDMQLHHIDFNKNNNSANNLEWLTSQDHKRKHIQRSDKNVCTKSKDNIYLENE